MGAELVRLALAGCRVASALAGLYCPGQLLPAHAWVFITSHPPGYRTDPDARRMYKLFHARWWVTIYLIVSTLNMALVMLEKPSVPDYLWVGPWLPIVLECVAIAVYMCVHAHPFAAVDTCATPDA